MTPPDSPFSIHEKPPRRRPPQKRGFAMLLALAMLGLVAMLLIFLAHYFAWELKRTRSTTADAQLNQLLLAGAQDALSKSKSTNLPKAPWTLALPTSLSDAHATVTLTPTLDSPDNATITIDAHYNTQQASQSLHLQKSNNAWRLTSATLAGAD